MQASSAPKSVGGRIIVDRLYDFSSAPTTSTSKCRSVFLIDKKLSTTRKDEKPFRGSHNYRFRWNVMTRLERAYTEIHVSYIFAYQHYILQGRALLIIGLRRPCETRPVLLGNMLSILKHGHCRYDFDAFILVVRSYSWSSGALLSPCATQSTG